MVLQSKETDALLSLLAYGLFQCSMETDFQGVEWQRLVASANDHVVTALLYPGIKILEDDVPSDVFDLIQKHAVRASARRERIVAIQQELVDVLSAGNISCAVLKGAAIEINYPYPELRLPGDIDILISEKQLSKAMDLLQQSGYHFTESNDIHASYMKQGVHIELHHCISRFPDTEKGRYAKTYLADAETRVVLKDIGKNTLPVLVQPYQSVSLLSHMERHICASGVGLRQLCDWAVTIHNMTPDEESTLLATLEKCGLLRFAQVLTRACELYLKLPSRQWTAGIDDVVVTAVMEDILSVGNFQAQRVARPFGSAVMEPYDLKGNGKSNMLSAYYRRVKRKMQSDYPWAKSRALTPLFCVYYPAKWTFGVLTKKRARGNVLATVRTAKKRESLLRQMAFYR